MREEVRVLGQPREIPIRVDWPACQPKNRRFERRGRTTPPGTGGAHDPETAFTPIGCMRSEIPPTSDSENEAIAANGVLDLLHRTVQGLALYSSDHPSVREAAAALSRELSSGGSVRVGVAHDAFLLEGAELRSEGLSQLADTLNKLDVAMVELRPGASPDEMLALACILCDAGRAALRGQELASEIERATGGHVAMTPLTFSGLSVRTGGGKESGGNAKGVEWGSLIDSLVGGGRPPCSETLDRAVVDAGPAGVRDIGLRLVQGLDEAQRLEGQAGAHGRERIFTFVQSLRSETRQRIVDCYLAGNASGVGSDASAGSGTSPTGNSDGDAGHDAVSGEMAALFGVDEVMSSLDRLEQAGVELSPETMKLFQKLAQLRPDPNDRDPGELPEGPELRESVGELMGVRGPGNFAPADYTSQINACVSVASEGPAHHWAIDQKQVMLQKAEIALELLRDEKDAEPGSDPIFRFLRENLDQIIDAGRIDLVAHGVRAAQRRAYKSVSTDEDGEPCELLAVIDDPARVSAILETGADCADLIALFREVDFLLAHLPPILAEGRSHRATRAGAEVLLAMPETLLGPLIEALARMDLAALRALLEVLVALPGSRLVALVEPLRDDENPHVRRLVYRAMDAAGVAWCGELLRRALRDEDRGVQRIALDHIRAKADACSIDILIGYLQGAITPRRIMRRETYRHAAQILADLEPDGEARLCEILLESRSRAGRQNAARMREIADVLAGRDESAEATRARRAWGRSISRTVAILTGARLAEGDQR